MALSINDTEYKVSLSWVSYVLSVVMLNVVALEIIQWIISPAPLIRKPFVQLTFGRHIFVDMTVDNRWQVGKRRYRKTKNRLLRVCYVPTTSTGLPMLLFLMRPLTVLMKQTRRAGSAIKQSIILRCLCGQERVFFLLCQPNVCWSNVFWPKDCETKNCSTKKNLIKI